MAYRNQPQVSRVSDRAEENLKSTEQLVTQRMDALSESLDERVALQGAQLNQAALDAGAKFELAAQARAALVTDVESRCGMLDEKIMQESEGNFELLSTQQKHFNKVFGDVKQAVAGQAVATSAMGTRFEDYEYRFDEAMARYEDKAMRQAEELQNERADLRADVAERCANFSEAVRALDGAQQNMRRDAIEGMASEKAASEEYRRGSTHRAARC